MWKSSRHTHVKKGDTTNERVQTNTTKQMLPNKQMLQNKAFFWSSSLTESVGKNMWKEINV